jgi:hypothetical protein
VERNIPLLIPLIALVALPIAGAWGYHAVSSGESSRQAAELAAAQAAQAQRQAQSAAHVIAMEAQLEKLKPLMMVAIPAMIAGAMYIYFKPEK